jgi:hypothetical protein
LVFISGRQNWWWTNAHNTGGNTWEWGTSGVTFDDTDLRWALNEPGTGDHSQERVSVQVSQQPSLFADDMSFINNVMCENAA